MSCSKKRCYINNTVYPKGYRPIKQRDPVLVIRKTAVGLGVAGIVTMIGFAGAVWYLKNYEKFAYKADRHLGTTKEYHWYKKNFME